MPAVVRANRGLLNRDCPVAGDSATERNAIAPTSAPAPGRGGRAHCRPPLAPTPPGEGTARPPLGTSACLLERRRTDERNGDIPQLRDRNFADEDVPGHPRRGKRELRVPERTPAPRKDGRIVAMDETEEPQWPRAGWPLSLAGESGRLVRLDRCHAQSFHRRSVVRIQPFVSWIGPWSLSGA
jgi:hypothetical protein